MELNEYKECLDIVFFNKWEIKDNAIIIHIPKETVSNSKKASTVIYDLFISIKLKKSMDFSKDYYFDTNVIRGHRTTYTFAHLTSGYSHSHLPHYCIGDYPDLFCLGESPIHISISEMRNNPNKDIFCFFLYQLKSLVKYESLGGVPYKYIRNISQGVLVENAYMNAIDMRKVLSHEFINPEIQIKKEGVFAIKNEKLIKSFTYSILDLFNEDVYQQFLFINNNNKYFKINSDSINNINNILDDINKANDEYIFEFKGDKYPLKIIGVNSELDKNINVDSLELHPDIKKQLIYHLNKKLTEIYIKQYGTYKTKINNRTKFII